jgi:hypothetical protein
MAGGFPSLSHGATTQSGLVHKLEIRADVQQFRSGAEQRYAISGLLNSFTIGLSNLSWDEVALVRSFWILQKGAFDPTWNIQLTDPASQTDRPYQYMAFADDEFTHSEQKPKRYAVTLNAVQTVGETVTVSPQPTFPLLATGAKWQLPSNSTLKFRTDRNDLEAGKRISYYAWPDPLRKWALEFPLITDAELADYVNHYLAQGGPVNEFSLADPDLGETHEHCRYAPGGITITRRYPNCNRLQLTIEQYKV